MEGIPKYIPQVDYDVTNPQKSILSMQFERGTQNKIHTVDSNVFHKIDSKVDPIEIIIL